MSVVAVGHTPDDGVFIRLLRQQRQGGVDPDAIHIRADRFVKRAAVVVPRVRFWIERVDVRRAAPHPDLNHGLGGRWPGGGKRREAQSVGK